MLPQRNRTGPKTKALADRFWPKVDQSTPDACWNWTAYRLPNGYGHLARGGHSGGMIYAHRAAYELTYGEIPDGLFVCHRCDNPPCCNPSHLFLGTQTENMQDATRKGRTRTGTNHPDALMTEETVREVHRLYDMGETQSSLASMFNVTRGCITDILRGKSWKHLAVPHAARSPGPRPKLR